MSWNIKQVVDLRGEPLDDYDLYKSYGFSNILQGSRKELLAAAAAVTKYFNKQSKTAKKKEKRK